MKTLIQSHTGSKMVLEEHLTQAVQKVKKCSRGGRHSGGVFVNVNCRPTYDKYFLDDIIALLLYFINLSFSLPLQSKKKDISLSL